VFNNNYRNFPGFTIDAVVGDYNGSDAFIGKVEKLDLTRFVSVEGMQEEDSSLLQQLRKFQPADINKYVSRNSPFSGIWENIINRMMMNCQPILKL
jgi:non-specific serine/threonine protein kinase